MEIMELTASQRKTFKFPDHANGDTIDRARSCASAIIVTMRQPSEEMLGAGYGHTGADGSDRVAREVWQAMIDAA
ncbi:MAG: hypothetical protein ABIO35_08220 [Nitrobacter sp.]